MLENGKLQPDWDQSIKLLAYALEGDFSLGFVEYEYKFSSDEIWDSHSYLERCVCDRDE